MIQQLPERIFLCGFMGTGKSTIGKKLARAMDWSFIDLDRVIEQEAGRAIAAIFDEEGEEGFRDLERNCLLEVMREESGVIALGGGSLQNQHLLDHIKLNGLLIFIETPFSVILDRISDKEGRPLLLDKEGKVKEGEELKKDLYELYNDRYPLYEQAELRIRSANYASVDDLVEALIKKIKSHVSNY